MRVTWKKWTSEIDKGVRSVPDSRLLEVATLLHNAPLILTAGNGGSSAIASHAAQAFAKPAQLAGGGRPAVCLTDSVPTLTAHANDGSWATALLESAMPFLSLWPAPALLLISSSGSSKNVCALAKKAREIFNLHVITLTGFTGMPLREFASIPVHINSKDYEVIEPVHDALLHRVQYHMRDLAGLNR